MCKLALTLCITSTIFRTSFIYLKPHFLTPPILTVKTKINSKLAMSLDSSSLVRSGVFLLLHVPLRAAEQLFSCGPFHPFSKVEFWTNYIAHFLFILVLRYIICLQYYLE